MQCWKEDSVKSTAHKGFSQQTKKLQKAHKAMRQDWCKKKKSPRNRQQSQKGLSNNWVKRACKSKRQNLWKTKKGPGKKQKKTYKTTIMEKKG